MEGFAGSQKPDEKDRDEIEGHGKQECPEIGMALIKDVTGYPRPRGGTNTNGRLHDPVDQPETSSRVEIR